MGTIERELGTGDAQERKDEAAHGKVAREPQQRYAYDPHLPPVLRFDKAGEVNSTFVITFRDDEHGGIDQAEIKRLARKYILLEE